MSDDLNHWRARSTDWLTWAEAEGGVALAMARSIPIFLDALEAERARADKAVEEKARLVIKYNELVCKKASLLQWNPKRIHLIRVLWQSRRTWQTQALTSQQTTRTPQ